ncbi:hypothetical protein MRB53_001380 [Persea americana]|uniref:Uncharacterized protein n=1 Tax=Persea americana TaxID=3435 RepID=A0ACC2MRG4_PERAE|nr:hypothetical protein MRB53_001380 [Persea americana]
MKSLCFKDAWPPDLVRIFTGYGTGLIPFAFLLLGLFFVPVSPRWLMLFLSNYIEEILVSAISYHLMNTKDPDYRNGKLVISSKSLSHGLSIFQECKLGDKGSLKMEANAGVRTFRKLKQLMLVLVQNLRQTEMKAPESKSETEISSPGEGQVFLQLNMVLTLTTPFLWSHSKRKRMDYQGKDISFLDLL